MSISPSYVDGLELRIKELSEQVEKLTGLVVMRFDHDVPPQFSQGYSEHEMVEPVTAAHCKWFVGEIVALREQVAILTKERDALVNAIDNEMVVTHMGVFNAGDDPKVALNKIYCYAQDLGKFFAEDACKEQLAALAEQNEKLRVALQAMVDEAFARNCGLKIADDALSLPDLASPVLNKYRAGGAPHD